MTSYVSLLDLGKVVSALQAEENTLVKASLLRNYVDLIDVCNGRLQNPAQHYERAYLGYIGVISQLNKEDKELIKVFQKRADECRAKAGLPRKD
jgi:hypothetical protein